METLHSLKIKRLGLVAEQKKCEALKATGIRKELLLIQSEEYLLKQKEAIESGN
jgi:hypothetical protein